LITMAVTPAADLMSRTVDERRVLLGHVASCGLDGVLFADHVSFRGGHGTDGLLALAALSQLHPTLRVHTVFLLPLRHPVPVARSIATLAELAPGRVEIGIGIGGEDRHEIEVCGVDPGTRGRRCEESLGIVRRLLTGEEVDAHGEFFDITACRIVPTPAPAVPLLVAGRSDAAIDRAGRLGDGWVGAWCSPRRFAEAIERCAESAANAGRGPVAWRHKYQIWVGLSRGDRSTARAAVAAAMQGFYRIPFEPFERYTPFGTPDEVAAALRAFVDLGVTNFDVMPCAPTGEDPIELAGEVRSLLFAGA
jgi:alkanesulfonate monooxygenase SsuD/methylene tetrahydromethanopterin reductase-like flavin-dependent oxidoreductase (luciferase family)